MKTLRQIDWPKLAFWTLYAAFVFWLLGKILASPLPGWAWEIFR